MKIFVIHINTKDEGIKVIATNMTVMIMLHICFYCIVMQQYEAKNDKEYMQQQLLNQIST